MAVQIYKMKAIIPTGGRGTRMQPLTFSTNKHFIPVGNKLLIHYPIESVANSGIKDVLITYNPGWFDYVRNQLGTGEMWGLKFKYILQEKPIGLANIVQVCEEALRGEPFVFHLGDNIFTEGISDLVEYFIKKKPNGLLTMVKHKENARMGVPYFDKNGKLIKYLEKPKNPPHDFAVPGLYFADCNFFKAFKGKDRVKPSARGEYEIPDPFQWMVDHGFNVEVHEYKGKWLDPGKYDDWLSANQYLLKINVGSFQKLSSAVNSVITGRVHVGECTKIVNSRITGPAYVGENVTITDSVIGPYTSIDNDCSLNKVMVENSVLMKDVKIENIRYKIKDSMIGAHVEISRFNNPKSVSFFVGEKSVIKV